MKKFNSFDKVLVNRGPIGWSCDFYNKIIDGYHHTINLGRIEDDNIVPYEGNESLLLSKGISVKDGDFVYVQLGNSRYIAIVNDHLVPYVYVEVGNFSIYSDDKMNNDLLISGDYRLANNEEILIFKGALKEKGFSWSSTNKSLGNWIPEVGEIYYHPACYYGEFVVSSEWREEEEDNNSIFRDLYKKGWVFNSEESCEVFCNQLNSLIG